MVSFEASVDPDNSKTAETSRSKVWTPFSDRRIRMGLAGHGICRFAAEFAFQHHPKVEVVGVSDLFPDRRAALAERVKCSNTYPSLEDGEDDGLIDAILRGRKPAVDVIDALK
jgi:hypothetical protein